jgi:hypothetical protein
MDRIFPGGDHGGGPSPGRSKSRLPDSGGGS